MKTRIEQMIERTDEALALVRLLKAPTSSTSSEVAEFGQRCDAAQNVLKRAETIATEVWGGSFYDGNAVALHLEVAVRHVCVTRRSANNRTTIPSTSSA